ncbi:MAG: aspartate kinase [Rikenellaceae bacterium]|nr:aspartate kinase [Rikenellaceae bacterium]MCL2692163.1 aspartate kinase [Rikenellaceae bacterium]
MKVYKFGGASVRSAEGVKNLREIVGSTGGRLFVVVSAMGKTTNALEAVVEHFMSGDRAGAAEKLSESRAYHAEICTGLFGEQGIPNRVAELFAQVENTLRTGDPATHDYDYWYDAVVSYGELVSTAIVAEYLAATGVSTKWIDIRTCFVTDTRHRDANVDMWRSASHLLRATDDDGADVFVAQGFIGASPYGVTTTLGREGSDYSAAVVANILDAESLTIWKDVPGVMNCDPKAFSDAVHIPELTYLDAVELAYGGAQIIHPKTIKPLQNKEIPLFVRSFADPSARGSAIRREMKGQIEVPVLILKHAQVLLTVRPDDFSFVLEERLAEVFTLLGAYGLKINLIQSSAVSLSLCIDNSRRLAEVVGELQARGFRTAYNTDMQLLTIRGYTPELLEKYAACENIFLTQKTRRTIRIVKREE